jgi:protein TonB
MARLLLALPIALAISYGLISTMAWLVDLNTQPAREKKGPLQFDIFVTEQEQTSQKMRRILPEPPKPTPETPKPKQAEPQAVMTMATPTLESLPEVRIDLSVSGMSISVPSSTSNTPLTSALQPAAAPKIGQNQQMMPLHRIEPVYPRKALQRKIEGYVVLSFDIDPKGKPVNIEILQAKPARVFNREAVKALSRWKYQPQIVDGIAQKNTGQKVRLEFKLR